VGASSAWFFRPMPKEIAFWIRQPARAGAAPAGPGQVGADRGVAAGDVEPTPTTDTWLR